MCELGRHLQTFWSHTINLFGAVSWSLFVRLQVFRFTDRHGAARIVPLKSKQADWLGGSLVHLPS